MAYKKKKLKITNLHQKNAEQGKYGGDAKQINQARKDRNKLIQDFLNN